MPPEPASPGHPLVRYTARRLAGGVAALVAISVLVFAGTELLPGDAATTILSKSASGGTATAEQTEVLRHRLGLDRPAPQRYLEWLGGIVHGDLGESLYSPRPVRAIIGRRLLNTLVLAGVAAALLVPLAIGFGLWAGARAGRPTDRIISSVAVAAQALPEFVTGTLLIVVFALSLRLLPPVSLLPSGASPLRHPDVLVLPVLTLLSVMAGQSIRMVRARMAEVMASAYIRAARLHGIPERRLVVRHALRNAVAPAVQLLANSIAWLIGGVVVVETLYNYPGLSQELIAGITNRDIPFVQSVAMVFAAFTVALYTLADFIVVALIPKLRTTQ